MSISEVVVLQEGVINVVLVAWEPLQIAQDVIVNEPSCVFAGDLTFQSNLDVNLILLTEVGPV